MIGKNQREDSGKRRKFTMHSFRRYVKTTISNAGYYDFSEMILGHRSGVNITYFRMAEKDRDEVWRKVEPFLTYLDPSALEAHGKDMQTQIDAMKKQHAEDLARVRAETQQEVLALKAALIAKSALMEALKPVAPQPE